MMFYVTFSSLLWLLLMMMPCTVSAALPLILPCAGVDRLGKVRILRDLMIDDTIARLDVKYCEGTGTDCCWVVLIDHPVMIRGEGGVTLYGSHMDSPVNLKESIGQNAQLLPGIVLIHWAVEFPANERFLHLEIHELPNRGFGRLPQTADRHRELAAITRIVSLADLARVFRLKAWTIPSEIGKLTSLTEM